MLSGKISGWEQDDARLGAWGLGQIVGRVVRGNPCKLLGLNEGMRGVGVTHWCPTGNIPTPLNPTTTLPAPPSLLYVPQSSCLTNWCFFFTAIWSCPCCADGKLSGKCYFIPQLNCFFFVCFCFLLLLFLPFCFPLIRAPMLHRLTVLFVLVLILLLVYYHAYVLLLEHCHFVCFQFF